MPEVDGGRFKAGTRNIRSGEMKRLFPGSGFRKNQWLRALVTPDSCDWSNEPLSSSLHSKCGWYYDGRDDYRDFPANGFFPGNFAAHPANAAIGTAGIIGSTPWRSATSYPSQVVIEAARGQAYCGQRNRSYNLAFGTFPGKDGARHRC